MLRVVMEELIPPNTSSRCTLKIQPLLWIRIDAIIALGSAILISDCWIIAKHWKSYIGPMMEQSRPCGETSVAYRRRTGRSPREVGVYEPSSIFLLPMEITDLLTTEIEVV
jgi:hypothetical protein